MSVFVAYLITMAFSNESPGFALASLNNFRIQGQHERDAVSVVIVRRVPKIVKLQVSASSCLSVRME